VGVGAGVALGDALADGMDTAVGDALAAGAGTDACGPCDARATTAMADAVAITNPPVMNGAIQMRRRLRRFMSRSSNPATGGYAVDSAKKARRRSWFF
jgi:hypothetical protein